jgi:peptidoglycan/xylan/chitin deacetylase (PgdA/CDA1 family)/glycosyltransferase involved in cell wall biosynthesis
LIPTRNRRDLLARTLGSLSRQSAPASAFEVVVASDGSTDGTPEAVRELARSSEWAGRALVCVEQEWAGASAARNAALRAARGDIVLYLDDDTVAEPDLVAVHLERHERGEQGQVVLGRIVPEERPEAVHRMLRRWWLGHYERLDRREVPRSGTPEVPFTATFTANMSLPRQAAMEVGGLDEAMDYGEDVEFGYRLSMAGLRFAYEPGAVVRTRNPKSPEAVMRDLYRIGQGSTRIYRKHPETLRHLPLSAYGETSLRMRLVRSVLLAASRVGPLERAIDRAFLAWAGSCLPLPVDRAAFEMVRDYYFWRGVRAETGGGLEWARIASAGVPVLVYHGVERQVSPESRRFTVSARRFALQMALLKLMRYRVEPLHSLVAEWERGGQFAPRTAAITFDDGYRNNRTRAWPILRRFGYPATLFFVTGFAGGASAWDRHSLAGQKPLMDWDEARTLDGQGFRVESHGVTHADLREVPPEQARREAAESSRHIEEHLGRPAELFAYPYGHYSDEAVREVELAGYRAAFSVDRGLNTLRTGRFALRRVVIGGDDHPLMFALKVWLGYDPLRDVPVLGRLTDRKWRKGAAS